MIRPRRRGVLAPGEMFPASDPAYRVSFSRLRSGLRIRVVERGDPKATPVLLLHGWGCSAYVFRHNFGPLADAGFRAIGVDLKGHGLSDKPVDANEYTIDALVEHVLEVVDSFGIRRANLVGHSMSGALLYHFAAKYPDRVQSIGMLAPVGLTGLPLLRLYLFLTPAWLTPFLRYVRPRLIVRLALKRVYGKRGAPTERDVEEYLAPSQFPDFAPAVRQALHSFDWEAAKHRALSTVHTPAAGVWGDLDHLMPRDGMAIYQRLVPGIRLKKIVGAGHIIPEETPAEVNEELLTLLKRTNR